MDVLKFFAKIDEKEIGALSLKELFLLPELNENTPIWHKGLENWKPFSETEIYSQYLTYLKEEQEKVKQEKQNDKMVRNLIFGVLAILIALISFVIYQSNKIKPTKEVMVEAAEAYPEEEPQTETDENSLLSKFNRIEVKIETLNRCSKNEDLGCIAYYFSFPLSSYYNKSNLTEIEFINLFKSSFQKYSYQELKIDSIKPSLVMSNVDFDPNTKHTSKLQADVYGTFYYQTENSEIKLRNVHDIYYFNENEQIIGVSSVNAKNIQKVNKSVKVYNYKDISFELNEDFDKEEINFNSTQFDLYNAGLIEMSIRFDSQTVDNRFSDKEIDDVVANLKEFALNNTEIQRQNLDNITLIDYKYRYLDGKKCIWIKQSSEDMSPQFNSNIETYFILNYPYIHSITISYKENQTKYSDLTQSFINSISF